MNNLFQSTPSVGRATLDAVLFAVEHNISIHALRGEGDRAMLEKDFIVFDISIHALRGEGDLRGFFMKARLKTFQPTPSVGRATHQVDKSL